MLSRPDILTLLRRYPKSVFLRVQNDKAQLVTKWADSFPVDMCDMAVLRFSDLIAYTIPEYYHGEFIPVRITKAGREVDKSRVADDKDIEIRSGGVVTPIGIMLTVELYIPQGVLFPKKKRDAAWLVYKAKKANLNEGICAYHSPE